MNKDHEIYLVSEDLILDEDKARLDGYLRGRAEAAELERTKKIFEKKFKKKKNKKNKKNKKSRSP